MNMPNSRPPHSSGSEPSPAPRRGSPMPSRPSLAPPPPPQGAAPVHLKPMSTYTLAHAKVGKNILSCLLMLLVAIAIVVIAGAYVIARTGLVHVPYFSEMSPPITPIRIVEADTMSPEEFSKQMQMRLFVASVASDGSREITVTEAELTGAMRGAIETVATSSDGIRVRNLQAAVSTSSVEVSGILWTKIGEIHVLGDLVPTIGPDGKVSVSIQRAYVGDLPLMTSLIEYLRQALSSHGIAVWETKIQSMNLKDVHLQDGSLRLSFSVGTPTPASP